jgi:hypothetical protein
MNHGDVKIVWHKKVGCRRFGYWIGLRDDRRLSVRQRKRSSIKIIESVLGPLGLKWQYQLADDKIILKLDDERDFLFFILKLG